MGHLVHRADFARAIATPMRARSAHFALHHVAGVPTRAGEARRKAALKKLSTVHSEQAVGSVDELAEAGRGTLPGLPVLAQGQVWLGCVLPKRHARRAVTRNLLRRQMRAVFASRHALLAGGLWLLRLRAPFPLGDFPSAASRALAGAARAELEQLLARAMR